MWGSCRKMKTKELKEKMLNALEGKFEVTRTWKDIDGNGECYVEIKFVKNGKEGNCYYYLTGYDAPRIEDCDYEEKDGEDIFGEIQNWIGKNLTYSIVVKVKGKEI